MEGDSCAEWELLLGLSTPIFLRKLGCLYFETNFEGVCTCVRCCSS